MGDFKITTRKSTDIIEIQGSFLFTEYLRNATDMAMADFSIEVLHYKSILEVNFVNN
jgi:drug/metabolite transporter superfamily protein YnfA